MAQLSAHFINWYRDKLLTHFDSSVCLDSNSISLIGCRSQLDKKHILSDSSSTFRLDAKQWRWCHSCSWFLFLFLILKVLPHQHLQARLCVSQFRPVSIERWSLDYHSFPLYLRWTHWHTHTSQACATEGVIVTQLLQARITGGVILTLTQLFVYT